MKISMLCATFFSNVRVVSLFWAIVTWSQVGMAQAIWTGETSPFVDNVYQYTFTDDVILLDPDWQVINGSAGKALYNNGVYTINVRWAGPGPGSITILNGASVVSTYDVIVIDNRPPTPETEFTITNNCGTTIVQRLASPVGANVFWYWQTTSSGTSTTLGSATILTLNNSSFEGEYYLRSRDETGGLNVWSEFSLIVGELVVHNIPPAPTIAHNITRTGPGPVTISTQEVPGATAYHWYTSSSAPTYDPAQTTRYYSWSNLTQSTEMFVAAAEGQCESSRLRVTATVLPNPVISAVGTDVVSGGSTVTLTTQSFTTYLWQYEDGNSVGSTQSVVVNKPGLYTVEVTNGSGTAVSAAFRVKDVLESQNLSFVADNTIYKRGVKSVADVSALSFQHRKQGIEYYDGAGRIIQTVLTQGSGTGKDVVKPFRYDNLNRLAISHLPYVHNQTNGKMVASPLQGTSGYINSPHYHFYNSPSVWNATVDLDSRAWSEIEFEDSPLARPVKKTPVGENFTTSYTTTNNGTNEANEVRIWVVNATTGLPESTGGGIWGANQLKVSDTRSYSVGILASHVKNYVTVEGKTVLSRVLSGSTWLDTYTVFDKFDNIVFILPPALIQELGTNYYPTQEQLDRLAYQWKYDNLNRRIGVKIPGAGWQSIVYDKRNRIVLSQSQNQSEVAPFGEWTFIKYDEFDRQIITGTYRPVIAQSREQLQQIVNELNSGEGYQFTRPPMYLPSEIQAGTDIVLTASPVAKEYQAANSVILRPGFAFSATTSDDHFAASIGDGDTPRSECFPFTNESNNQITYYDNYRGNSQLFNDPGFAFVPVTWQNPDGEPFVPFHRIKGKITGSSIRVLGTNRWLNSVRYFDKNQKLIQGITQNHLGGISIVSTQYAFDERILAQVTRQVAAGEVAWQNLVNVSLAQGMMLKSSPVNGWDAGASSYQRLAAGSNGWTDVRITALTNEYAFGLSDTDVNTDVATMDYAIRVLSSSVEIIENNLVKKTLTNVLKVGDNLRVERLSNVVYYRHNGRIVFTSSLPSVGELQVDVSLRSPNMQMAECQASFTGAGETAAEGYTVMIRNVYDQGRRVTNQYHRLNSQPEVLLVSTAYNETGQDIDWKYHSADGINFLQSVDIRRNIRNWITNINGGSTSPGEKDYFSQEVAYESSPVTGASVRGDGLAASVVWTQDLSSDKEAYNFIYTPERYMQQAVYKKYNAATGWVNDMDHYSEQGLTYDRNGNIKSLSRNQGTTSTIDQLEYQYGSPAGNQLKKVVDSGTGVRESGFTDGTNSDDDFGYDGNGNLKFDRNKGITNISYNHVDLPVQITFADGTSCLYTYDAAGVRLTQQVFAAGGQEVYRRDESGEFIFEQGMLTMIKHEEGQLVPPSFTNRIANREASGLEGFVSLGNVSLTATANAGENYVKVKSNQTGGVQGVWPIGGTLPVKPGEKYAFKILGYSETPTPPVLRVWGNGAGGDIVAAGPALPVGESGQTWVTVEFTVPPDVTQVKLGVQWTSATINDTYFINRVALYNLSWEYEYILADIQGSVRAVLNANPATVTYNATMELNNATTEQQQFLNINYSNVVPHPTANATPGGMQVIKVNKNYRVGPAKSISVYPGDAVFADVNAYYATGGSYVQSSLPTIIGAVAGVLSGGTQTIVDGISTAYTGTGSNPNLLLSPNQGNSKPSAFLNYILFDENYLVLEAKSAPVGAAGVRHIVSLPTINVKKKGILFVYLSFDDEAAVDVFFDDLKLVHYESPLIQSNAYYPFGMTSASWVREGEVHNPASFQGKYYDSKTKFHDFGTRQYSADLGRWFSVDNQGQFASPYAAMGNVPVISVDPNGEFVVVVGAAIGLIVGYVGARQAGLEGADLWTHTIVSGVIGAFSGALGGGIGTAMIDAGRNAILSSAVAGGVSGAFGGFYGAALSNQNPLEGAWKGALSGLAGGGTGAMFKGGGGALLGGAVGGGLSSALNEGSVGDAFTRAAVCGAVAFANYKVMTMIANNQVSGNEAWDGLSDEAKNVNSKMVQRTLSYNVENGNVGYDDNTLSDFIKGGMWEEETRFLPKGEKMRSPLSGKMKRLLVPTKVRYFNRDVVDFRKVMNDHATVSTHTHRGVDPMSDFSMPTAGVEGSDVETYINWDIKHAFMLNGTVIRHFSTSTGSELVGFTKVLLVRNVFGF